jgi:hypothetical protein
MIFDSLRVSFGLYFLNQHSLIDIRYSLIFYTLGGYFAKFSQTCHWEPDGGGCGNLPMFLLLQQLLSSQVLTMGRLLQICLMPNFRNDVTIRIFDK